MGNKSVFIFPSANHSYNILSVFELKLVSVASDSVSGSSS